MAFATSDSVKKLLIDILRKLVSTTDNVVDDKVEEVQVTIADEMEVSEKLTSFEAKVTELNESITDLEGEKETLTEEVGRLTALLSKAEAGGTEVKTEGDPSVVSNKAEDANSKFFNELAALIK